MIPVITLALWIFSVVFSFYLGFLFANEEKIEMIDVLIVLLATCIFILAWWIK